VTILVRPDRRSGLFCKKSIFSYHSFAVTQSGGHGLLQPHQRCILVSVHLKGFQKKLSTLANTRHMLVCMDESDDSQ